MSTITPGRMRTFLAVVEHGSIRAAAASLHVTEPAVSAGVSQLEKGLAAKLVERAGRGIRLTDAGRLYADYCRTILGLMTEAADAVQSSERGRLRLGAVATASECVLPRLLSSFRQQFAEVEVSLAVLPRDALFESLAHHEVDAVFAGRPPRNAGLAGLTTRALRKNRLIAVGAPGREWQPLTATWLLRGPGSGTRDTALGLLAQLDATPSSLTLGTHGAVVAAAREGLGVTLVHADAVDDDLERGDLVQLPLAGTPLDRPWHIVTTDTPTPTTLLFIDHVTSSSAVGTAAFQLARRRSG